MIKKYLLQSSRTWFFGAKDPHVSGPMPALAQSEQSFPSTLPYPSQCGFNGVRIEYQWPLTPIFMGCVQCVHLWLGEVSWYEFPMAFGCHQGLLIISCPAKPAASSWLQTWVITMPPASRWTAHSWRYSLGWSSQQVLATNWSAVKMPPCHAPMPPFVWIWWICLNHLLIPQDTFYIILHEHVWNIRSNLKNPQDTYHIILHHTTSILFHHIIIMNRFTYIIIYLDIISWDVYIYNYIYILYI